MILSMAIVPSLDIPPGLEEQFFGIVQFASATEQNRIVLRRSSPARNRFYTVGDRSLFVKLQPYFDALTQSDRFVWYDNWGGYPGTGYSLFTQINAPNYQNNLPYQLIAPIIRYLGYYGFGKNPLTT